MTFLGGLCLKVCVIVCLWNSFTWATPVPQEQMLSIVAKRQAKGGGDRPKIRNEVAEFLESGKMINDYVWVDVTTKKFVPVPGNDLEFGNCSESDELIYFDNTVIENSGPSTLNGTLEIYIDAPVNITCVRAIDQIKDGFGAVPTYNSMGSNWAKIDVSGQYGRGFHFHIYVYGTRQKKSSYEKEKERKDSQSNLV
ncbi:AAEL005789-PA [Aedes aegypti]|uniref:AAEL005789-PA n=1 Tax=Aedes aegypti TaxID=7159 RepID=Q178T1_AEDAE|nr:AAEL005789-PA [Aedes aegypti]